jgi:hypothetical protein
MIELPLLLLGIFSFCTNSSKMGKRVILLDCYRPLASTFVSGKSYVLRDFDDSILGGDCCMWNLFAYLWIRNTLLVLGGY